MCRFINLVQRADHAFKCSLQTVDAKWGLAQTSVLSCLLQKLPLKKGAHPLRAFSMSDQANHLFSCEESFEACAVGIVVVDDHRSAIIPDNRLGSGAHLSKQFVLVG